MMLLYRCAISLIAPILALGSLLRGGGLICLGQRLGGGAGHHGAIWLHGASNGELTSAQALIAELAKTDHVVVTANSVTGRDMVAAWALANVHARLAPLDLRWVLRRFRTCWRPSRLIIIENELWPNRIATASEPVIVVSARLSRRSCRRWRRIPSLGNLLLDKIGAVFPQDTASGQRLLDLGLRADKLQPPIKLKSSVSLAPADPGELADLRRVYDREYTILAASTHHGEDKSVLDAFVAARKTRPELRLIMAPRHPRRAPEIIAMVSDLGLTCARRTAADAATSDVYLADTMGEMALWYELAGVTFVGGSLVDKGGHTPYEPAQFGSAIITGPFVGNFAEAYANLASAHAVSIVHDANDLADALAALGTAGAQRQSAGGASQALLPGGETQPQIEELVKAILRQVAPNP